MNSFDIREKFFNYFKKNNHTEVSSSSLIPAQDPTLLFANAGMNQFKDCFLGKETRSYKRAVSIQKCIRAGGKHNDLENVGFTKRHLTFFEMMGNFSFGDYFKKEAIQFAWEFLTGDIGLDKSKLYASVYLKDDEAYDIWNKLVGLPTDKIVRLGEADNFWQMGDTGPCGPCTEIYIDRGLELGCGQKSCAPGCSCDRFLEIWNLVFMQYDRQQNGELKPLTQTGVDTGMGLERLCSVIQNKDSVFDTDLFVPILEQIEKLTDINYQKADNNIKAAFRVLADHVRSSSFAIADGCIPSNEGRGYVLRKIIRRAALFAQKLNPEKNIFPDIAPALINFMGKIYPELETNSKLIISVLKSEVEKFASSLTSGQAILEKYLQENKSKKITGQQAFKLYDTYGFPLELTKVIAHDRNLEIDLDGFEKEMEKQRLQSGKKIELNQIEIDESLNTVFTGYDEHINETEIIGIIFDNKTVDNVKAGTGCYVITKRSPFYVECGGQVSDQGYIKIGNKEAKLLGLKKINNAIGAYIETPEDIKVGDKVTLIVDSPSRINTMKNHTATHLLQAALITILGKHVKQSGSVVEPDYLRFDFTYDENLTSEQIKAVEDLVNKKILENIPLNITQSTLKEATSKGVIAFFGEKYNPEKVRVVEVPGFSAELCGGTHVRATGDIGCFKITQISALSAGNRRIVAITGPQAVNTFQESFNIVKNLSQEFKVPNEHVLDAIKKQKEQVKNLQAQIKNIKKEFYNLKINDWSKEIANIKDINYLYLNIQDSNSEELKEIAQNLSKIKPGFYFLITQTLDRSTFFAYLDSKLTSKIDLKEFANFLKSKNLQGGAKDTYIQGGGSKIDPKELEKEIKNWLEKNIK